MSARYVVEIEPNHRWTASYIDPFVNARGVERVGTGLEVDHDTAERAARDAINEHKAERERRVQWVRGTTRFEVDA